VNEHDVRRAPSPLRNCGADPCAPSQGCATSRSALHVDRRSRGTGVPVAGPRVLAVVTRIRRSANATPSPTECREPVTVFALEDQTLLLVDGYHRVVAAQQAGRTTVRAEVRVGTKAEALQFAVDVAQVEAGVSAEQAREAIRRYSGRQG